MTRNNKVTKYLIGCSYKNDEFDRSFLFRDCIMRVMELQPLFPFTSCKRNLKYYFFTQSYTFRYVRIRIEYEMF